MNRKEPIRHIEHDSLSQRYSCLGTPGYCSQGILPSTSDDNTLKMLHEIHKFPPFVSYNLKIKEKSIR
jgi:hypothetical protein